MNEQTQPQMPTAEQEADIFRQQASVYMVCFHDGCERHGQCLHWLVGQHVNDEAVVLPAVSPRNRLVRSGQCPLFRPKVYATLKRGMMHFYDQMPGRLEHGIREELIGLFNRKVYYQLRNGERAISPDEQSVIADVCRRHGWPGSLDYDGEEAGYVW